MTSAEHTKFRSTKIWKEFRKSIIQTRGAICECCGTRYSGKRTKQLQIHHKDPVNYTDLNPEKFVILDSSCHDLIERMSTKLKGSRSGDIPHLENWIRLLYTFLPYETQRIVVEKYDDYLSSKMPDEWKDLCRTNENEP